MAIPDYQSIMLPLLELAADNQIRRVHEAVDLLARQFRLTDEEKREVIPSGRVSRFHNNVTWARTYLKKAGLLEDPKRGEFRITERGSQVLAGKHESIGVRFLEQFDEFMEFKTARRTPRPDTGKLDLPDDTPEEALQAAYQTLRNSVASDLLDQEHDFRGPGGTLSPCDPAHLLHKERLILRMQIELRFIDDQVVVPVIVQVREENEELLDTVALVTIQPIRLPAVPSHRRRHEVAGVPFQHHIAPEEMAQRRFYLDAEVQSLFEYQNGIHARSFCARPAQIGEGALLVSGSEVVAEIFPRIGHLAQAVRTKQPRPERASPEMTQKLRRES